MSDDTYSMNDSNIECDFSNDAPDVEESAGCDDIQVEEESTECEEMPEYVCDSGDNTESSYSDLDLSNDSVDEGPNPNCVDECFNDDLDLDELACHNLIESSDTPPESDNADDIQNLESDEACSDMNGGTDLVDKSTDDIDLIRRYDLSDNALKFKDCDRRDSTFIEGMNDLTKKRSDLIKEQRDLIDNDATINAERIDILNKEIKQMDYDIESSNGSGAVAPFSDFVYRDLDDFEPSSGDNLPKDPSLWEGDVGNSLMLSNDEGVNKILQDFGQRGVQYKNNNPDFRPFTKHYDDKFGYFDGEVAISSMKGKIDSYGNEINPRTLNQSKDMLRDCKTLSDLGNYAQADLALSKKLNVSPKEIRSYRNDNNMTWHECRDGVTMQLVPEAINHNFNHYGGTSLIKEENTQGIVLRDYSDIEH